MRKKSGPADIWAVAALLLISVLFFRHVLLSNRIIFGVDVFTYFYPYRAYAAQSLLDGRVPLWNPFLFVGVPFLANPQAAVFYPLNLALCWLSAPKLVAWSAAIHVALGATCTYLYARRVLRLSAVPALLAAVAFAFGGFLSGQVEHINQLNVSVWFPVLLLLWEQRAAGRWKAVVALGLVTGIGLLAGHAQMSYISIAGLLTYAALPLLLHTYRAIQAARQPGTPAAAAFRPLRRSASRALVDSVAMLSIAIALSAIQLLPALELAQRSIRSGGLSYRKAVAFSFKPLPRFLRYAFLPPWGQNLADVFGGSYYTEYLAYVGTLPLILVAAWALGAVLRHRAGAAPFGCPAGHRPLFFVVLSGLGVFLALGLYNPLYFVLYKIVPGLSLFRVPARWLFLYAFGAAILSGIALQYVVEWIQETLAPPRWLPLALQLLALAISMLELFYAASALPFNHPIAPQAFSSLRSTPAYILAAQRQSPAPGRFLSMSDILYDPGDLAEVQAIFRHQLSPQELYDYIVSLKYKEIIAPNLPLAWQIYAADGYDGGLLPLARYTLLQRLFLDPEDILIDGRLREGLERIPPARRLSLLNIAYVITDKVQDVWIDDIFYDLAFDTRLSGDERAAIHRDALPSFQATGLGIVSYLEGAIDVADGTPVAKVNITMRNGEMQSYTLYAGRDTAQGTYSAAVQHAQARIGRQTGDTPPRSDYITTLHWDAPAEIAALAVRAVPFGGAIRIRGLALIDERDGSSVPLILSDRGHFVQVHSGDTKIYQVLDTLPRAFIVHNTHIYADDQAALAALADPSFDPARQAILAAGRPLDVEPPAPSTATVATYQPESVTIHAALDAPGYLILSDTWYPGWKARVDGQPARIERANIHFRAVYLSAGTHTVTFRYQPNSYRIGAAITLLSLAGIALAKIPVTFLLKRWG